MLTFPEVCAQLRLSPKTVRKIIKSGDLKASRVGSQWRVREEDLDAYIEKAAVK